MSLNSFNILPLIRITQQNTCVLGYLPYFTFDTLKFTVKYGICSAVIRRCLYH